MARVLSPAALEHALATARLDLTESRRKVVTGAAESVFGLADALDAVPLGDTPIGTAFDARWV